MTGLSPLTSSCAGVPLVSLCDGEVADLIMSLTTVNEWFAGVHFRTPLTFSLSARQVTFVKTYNKRNGLAT